MDSSVISDDASGQTVAPGPLSVVEFRPVVIDNSCESDTGPTPTNQALEGEVDFGYVLYLLRSNRGPQLLAQYALENQATLSPWFSAAIMRLESQDALDREIAVLIRSRYEEAQAILDRRPWRDRVAYAIDSLLRIGKGYVIVG